MRPFDVLCAALALGTLPRFSQAEALPQGQGLLFAPLGAELSNQSATLAGITHVNGNEVQHVVPLAAGPTSAAFAPRQCHEVMLGDGDLDGLYFEPTLYGAIDALLPAVDNPNTALAGMPLISPITPNARNVWFSPAARTTSVAGPPLHQAELGRLLPGGVLERFLTRAQLYSAFGIPNNVTVNIDAAALDATQALYLSFEDPVMITTTAHGAVVVDDGAILAIPVTAITWGSSTFDDAYVINMVVPGSGLIIRTEPEVDMLVAASGIRDNAGALVATIGDLDGLEIDPAGGTFYSAWVENSLAG